VPVYYSGWLSTFLMAGFLGVQSYLSSWHHRSVLCKVLKSNVSGCS
jgi:hypothetical protein